MRNCSKCGAVIPAGELFCPKCGAEVQLVANYETMESRAHIERKKQLEKEARERELAEQAAREQREKKRKLQKRIRIISVSVFMVAALIIAALCINTVLHNNSFDYQYTKAAECYENKDYSNALNHIEKAVSIEPQSEKGGILLGRVQEALDRPLKAVSAYETVIQYHPESEEAYSLLIPLYIELELYDELQALLSACKVGSILEQYGDYITYEPVFSLESGEYTGKQTLELSVEGNGDIYYTLDGTIPSADTLRYTDPIELDEGTTIVNAVYINTRNISSEMVTGKYQITAASATAPKITPASGVYTASYDGSDPKITIDVPEGYTAYYSFDEKATEKSLRYSGPVSMRSGTHIFYAVLADKDGNLSDIGSATYIYNKAAPTPSASPKKYSGSSDNSSSDDGSASNNNSNNDSNDDSGSGSSDQEESSDDKTSESGEDSRDSDE